MRERTQGFFPSEEKECCTHITPRGGEWGGDIWEKEGDSSRQGDFSPIHSPQEDTSERDRRVLSTPVAPNWKQQSGKSRHGRLQKV